MDFGFGRNLWDVTPVQLIGYLDLVLSLSLTYWWPTTLVKLSILALYWRISPDKIFRGCIIAMAFVCLAYTITFTVLLAGPCNPLLGTPESAVCLNNIAISQAVLTIVTDGIIVILPVPTIHSLHMPLKARLSVGCILTLGSAYVTGHTHYFSPSNFLPSACIASIVRIAYVRAMVDNPDMTFTQCAAGVWSLVEMNLGTLCNSLAALKPFVRRHLPSLLSKTTESDESNGNVGGSSYAKHNRNRGWGHSYYMHSCGGSTTREQVREKDEIVIKEEITVEYEHMKQGSAASGRGDSTESILALHLPGNQAV